MGKLVKVGLILLCAQVFSVWVSSCGGSPSPPPQGPGGGPSDRGICGDYPNCASGSVCWNGQRCTCGNNGSSCGPFSCISDPTCDSPRHDASGAGVPTASGGSAAPPV